jgi:hypothetical protein
MAGKRVRCPACQAVLVVPDLESSIQPADRPGAAPAPVRASDVPNPFGSGGEPGDLGPFSRRKPPRKANEGLAQILLAGGTGLLVMIVVTGAIVLFRNGRSDTVSAANGTGSNMKEFVSGVGKFRVMMPGTPVERRQRFGPMTLMMYMIETRDVAYMVGYCDVPIPAHEAEGVLQRRFDGAREGALRNINGGLLKENRIRLHGREPGREIEANVPGKGILRARFYVVGQRMYQVLVVGNANLVRAPDATLFLDSFSRTN